MLTIKQASLKLSNQQCCSGLLGASNEVQPGEEPSRLSGSARRNNHRIHFKVEQSIRFAEGRKSLLTSAPVLKILIFAVRPPL